MRQGHFSFTFCISDTTRTAHQLLITALTISSFGCRRVLQRFFASPDGASNKIVNLRCCKHCLKIPENISTIWCSSLESHGIFSRQGHRVPLAEASWSKETFSWQSGGWRQSMVGRWWTIHCHYHYSQTQLDLRSYCQSLKNSKNFQFYLFVKKRSW